MTRTTWFANLIDKTTGWVRSAGAAAYGRLPAWAAGWVDWLVATLQLIVS
jgi:hypothetical protein